MALDVQKQKIDWEHASWEEACEAVKQLTDLLGNPVDEGIVETVAALNLLGFSTYQSCEGHLDHGAYCPWVMICDPDRRREWDRRLRAVNELEERAKAAQTEDIYDLYLTADTQLQWLIAQWGADDPLYRRLVALLEDFYAERPEQTSPDRLLINRFRSPGMFRIEPGLSRAEDTLPAFLKEAYLKRGQAEMQAFTSYLKRRWQEYRARES